jgi:hypothetical protein
MFPFYDKLVRNIGGWYNARRMAKK